MCDKIDDRGPVHLAALVERFRPVADAGSEAAMVLGHMLDVVPERASQVRAVEGVLRAAPRSKGEAVREARIAQERAL